MKNIYVTKPTLPKFDEYSEIIRKIWDNHILTNSGPLHQQFNEELEKKFDTGVALFNNGHLALESLIRAYDFEPGKEVITTAFTFVSTTHAIINNGLVPVFCDIKISDYTIDESKIEQLITDNTVAILPVHVYGHPCDVNKIQEIANKYNIKVIYDAAHAFGVLINNRSIVKYGDASMISFHATKVFNTIEGGMIGSDDKQLIDKSNKIKNFGITGPETVELIGINSKMNEFQAGMGLLNLKNFDKTLKERKKIYTYYINKLKDISGIKIPNIDCSKFKYNYAYLPILITDEYIYTRNEIFNILAEKGIHARKYFSPLVTEFACYGKKFDDSNLINSKYVSSRIMTLPLYNDLELDDIDLICSILKGNI